jgi:hypothetical protein
MKRYEKSAPMPQTSDAPVIASKAS